jgi:Ca2+-binding EF-hand superfamily protein
MDNKHLNEDQFGMALVLLGQTSTREQLKRLYDDLAISDGMHLDGFFVALNRLRQKSNDEEGIDRIQDAFDALYEGTCLNDDQKNFAGQRYIYAADFRLLLTITGEDNERLTDEEANELLRECRPIYPQVINPITEQEEDDGIAVAVLRGKIFFEQYRAMLLDISPLNP